MRRSHSVIKPNDERQPNFCRLLLCLVCFGIRVWAKCAGAVRLITPSSHCHGNCVGGALRKVLLCR